MDSKVFISFFSLFLLQLILSADSRAIREERGLARSKRTQRFRRFALSLHDYALLVFKEKSEWEKEQCNLTFNCWPVNPTFCNPEANSNVYIPPDDNARDLGKRGCVLDFTTYLKSTESVLGADLSLYTKTEKNLYVEIIDNRHWIKIGSVLIPSFCGGWQTIQIKRKNFIDGFRAEMLQKQEILIRVLMEKEEGNYTQVSCDEIKNVFYIDIDNNAFNFSKHSLYKREAKLEHEADKKHNENAQITPEPQTDEPATEKTDKGGDETDTFTPTSKPKEDIVTSPTLPKEEIYQNRFLPRMTLHIHNSDPHSLHY